MNRCEATHYDSKSGQMVQCSYMPDHETDIPHAVFVGTREVAWQGGVDQPMGLISEIVHYVRAFQLEDGSYEELPAIVSATYTNGAKLHVFVDPASPHSGALPEPRTRHDPQCLPDTWHLASECKHR